VGADHISGVDGNGGVCRWDETDDVLGGDPDRFLRRAEPPGLPSTLAAVNVVLFDLYDTLVWTEWPLLRERLAAAIGVAPRDLKRGFIETRDARGVGTFGSAEKDLAAVFRAAGASPTEDELRELTRIEIEALAGGGVRLFDDSLPVLRELRRRGVATAIISNCDHSTRPIVDALGLEDEVDAVVLSFEARVLKPDPVIFRTALDRLGADPGGSTFVDDQPAYLDGAAELGMRTLQIVRPTDPHPVDPGDHPVIEDLWGALPGS
jgi:putative hydrolase of the HAD superfamily